jgi:23S rRNA (cytidine1920-2'-O)/16S rRNA (cytidine1409-2'-O)-methyltransferase
MKDRIDKVLVQLSLASTRSQAAQYIKEGVVYYRGEQLLKSSFLVEPEEIEVRKDVHYVGRGAYKIQAAIEKFKINPDEMVVADVGASTGGFTDYLLKAGVKKVYAIDVGHDQLAPSLRENPIVINLEGINIRDPYELPEKVDLVVADLSYISLKLTLESMFSLAKPDGKLIILVKPQFEVGKEGLGKGGIVKDPELRLQTLKDIYDFCLTKNFYLVNAMRSPIQGKTGNIEYLFYFDKAASSAGYLPEQLNKLDLEEEL